MKTTTKKIYQDMINFFYNQCKNIILLIISSTAIGIAIKYYLTPNSEQLQFLNEIHDFNIQKIIKELSTNQQQILLQASIANIISNIISNLLLITGILSILHLASNNKIIHLKCFIDFSKSILLKLTPLIFFITLLVQLGLLMMIIPGIIFAIAFSLSPILTVSKNLIFTKSLYKSTKLAYYNYKLIAPTIIIWLLAKFFILILINQFTILPVSLLQIIINIFNHLITALLIIYLYRLNMILN